MFRQRCTSVLNAAALAAALSFPAAPARAQQLFINSLWVSRPEQCVNWGGKFYCSAPSATTTKGGATPLAACPLPRSAGNFSGNISNNPHIEFDQFLEAGNPAVNQCGIPPAASPTSAYADGSTYLNYCNSRVMLCVNVGFNNNQSGNTPIAIDKISFEIFKFAAGANALNPESTPPVRTFSIDAPGTIPGNGTTTGNAGTIPFGSRAAGDPAPCPSPADNAAFPDMTGGCGYCTMWDATINIAGELGKSNGQYGFRAKVETNQTGINGNIQIDQTRPYPSGTTLDCSCDGAGNAPYNTLCRARAGNVNGALPGTVLQQPITVDVVDVHNVRSTPTIVGTFSGVLAEPYAVTYRLAKDAITNITISESDNPDPNFPPVIKRHLVDKLPRVGEGVPDGTLQNGDAWNGRDDNGDLLRPGAYLATIQAQASDQFGTDLSAPVTRQISLDPLQITDILVQPLTSQSTSLAVLTYTLTEPATVYIDIYPPGTQFCNGLNSVNSTALDDAGSIGNTAIPPKDFDPRTTCGAGSRITPLRRIVEQKDFRKPVVSFWDGRDRFGNIMDDGDYVFVIYASLPSQNGFPFAGTDRRIWSSTAKSGFLSILRGMVTISQVTPATTVIGSSPSVAGLNPFIFSYSLSRDALVSMKIYREDGTTLVRTLVNNEPRPANFLNREIWFDAMDNTGNIISSGTYLVQLTAADPFFPVRVATTTALFQANLYRITDVFSIPLQAGSTDSVQLSYQLSQTMEVAWNIYAPGTTINPVVGGNIVWPPCNLLIPSSCSQTQLNGTNAKPFITIHGIRPGRLKITEFWDGRDTNGLYVPDGSYPFTLVAQSTTTPRYYAIDRVVGVLTIARGQIVFPIFTITPNVPTLHNSSGTITLPPYELDYSVTRQSSMTIHILTTDVQPKVVRTLISGQVRDANLLYKEFWDARDDRGSFVNPGFYTLQAIATDLASQLASGSTVQQTIAVNPLRVYDVAIAAVDNGHPDAEILYQVSETMKVAVKVYRPGTTFDPNGNPSPPESISLIKRIVGVRPARQLVTERWDGTDLRLSKVPDGNYLFKIVASTDTSAIDTVTGNLSPGAAVAEDIPISEIPVVRGTSADPASEFETNTFIYPNPVNTSQGTFNIYVPLQSRVTMKIFNIAGELVYTKDFGQQPADTYVSGGAFKWSKVNEAGRALAPGVYFALIREEETLGAKNVLQTVKKILIP